MYYPTWDEENDEVNTTFNTGYEDYDDDDKEDRSIDYTYPTDDDDDQDFDDPE